MGDHLPSFIALSFAERRGDPAATPQDTDESAEDSAKDDNENAA